MAEGWVELPWGHIPQSLLFVNLILLIYQVAWSKAVGGWQTNTAKVNARLVGTNAWTGWNCVLPANAKPCENPLHRGEDISDLALCSPLTSSHQLHVFSWHLVKEVSSLWLRSTIIVHGVGGSGVDREEVFLVHEIRHAYVSKIEKGKKVLCYDTPNKGKIQSIFMAEHVYFGNLSHYYFIWLPKSSFLLPSAWSKQSHIFRPTLWVKKWKHWVERVQWCRKPVITSKLGWAREAHVSIS